MTPWPLTPATDHIRVNLWERDIKILAGEIHDGFEDTDEVRQKLHAMVELCSELLACIERRADSEADKFAREERETSVPPLGAA